MSHARTTLVSAGRILLVWALAIALENLVIGFGYRSMFAGYWEMAIARRYLSPLLLAALVVPALALAAVGELGAALRRAGTGREARLYVGLAALFGAAAALSVSTGRHTESWAVRVPFMLVTAGLVGGAVRVAMPRFTALSAGARAGSAGALAVSLWVADSFIFPRLYPGFHESCHLAFLVALAVASGALPASRAVTRTALGTLLVSVALMGYAGVGARGAQKSDNLRMVLLDRAPLLGRAVRLAAWVAPPDASDEGAASAKVVPSGEVARALDWTGRDVVLVTIDALRADHLSSYGYTRPTTPNIDALAARGTRFSHAYCPTPHTSYSVTSMLTGKYMKPLLALGVGEGSETLATHMRRYGYRTAAFYPPAVFFIDEARFVSFRDSGLDFEYRKVEFADRATRVAQVRRYLASAPKDRPLFLWVHLFEPHEPYVAHEGRTFGDPKRPTDVDAYDSEVAEADATVGEIVADVEQARPGATFVVSADHGEEFGDHGGRYHGTTVYEEQVRVPLVVTGPGVRAQTAEAPVQTIDILPTVLSALGIPRPARVRGRDLGKVLRDGETAPEEKAGFAFAETDEGTLVAEGRDRLVCARKVAACALYDITMDPRQTKDLGAHEPRGKALRARLAQTERDHGRYEGGTKLPDALRRGKQGEADAAEDVAALFDDASPEVRREAAEVAFWLNRPAVTKLAAERAFGREDDGPTRTSLALLLVRAGGAREAETTLVVRLFEGHDVGLRRKAALALADGGDPRGVGVLAAWLDDRGAGLELDRARELLSALARHKAKAAVPSLVGALSDLRIRPYAADALAAIGEPSARPALLTAFAAERYRPTRVRLAEALVVLGAKDELYQPLAMFAGMPEPLDGAVSMALRAGLLVPKRGGLKAAGDGGLVARLEGLVTAPRRPFRVLVEVGGPGGAAEVRVDGATFLPHAVGPNGTSIVAEGTAPSASNEVRLEVTHPAGVRGAWVVPLSDELPPPPKEAWDGGTDEDDAGLSADAKAE